MLTIATTAPPTAPPSARPSARPTATVTVLVLVLVRFIRGSRRVSKTRYPDVDRAQETYYPRNQFGMATFSAAVIVLLVRTYHRTGVIRSRIRGICIYSFDPR